MFVIESDFEYKGYRCVVIFIEMGHRCGYVGVPEGHPLYLVDEYDEEANLEMNFDVHGGITYTGKGHPIDNDLWWIGFDCAHYGDEADIDTLKKISEEEWKDDTKLRNHIRVMELKPFKHGTVKSKEYVEEECKKLVDQIVDWTEEHTDTPDELEEDNTMIDWTKKELEDAGYTIDNATITSVDLSMRDYGCLTLSMGLEGCGWGTVYGGYVLGKGYVGADEFEGSKQGMESIMRIMDVVGCDTFNNMEGKIVRVAIKGWGSSIKIIGNAIKEKWFDAETFYDAHKDKD